MDCAAGKYSSSTGATSAAHCIDCREGTFSPAPGSTACDTGGTIFCHDAPFSGAARPFAVAGSALCVPESLYPAASVAHCVLEKEIWKDLAMLDKSGAAKVWSTGGLGKKMVNYEFEVWLCTTLSSCGGAGGEVCFTFSERHEIFVPWGYACELEVTTSECIDIVQTAGKMPAVHPKK